QPLANRLFGSFQTVGGRERRQRVLEVVRAGERETVLFENRASFSANRRAHPPALGPGAGLLRARTRKRDSPRSRMDRTGSLVVRVDDREVLGPLIGEDPLLRVGIAF